MRSILIALAASTVLAGCASNTANIPAPPEAAAVPEAAPVPAPAPKPTYGTFGFDSAGMNQSAVPGDDFFSYANGTWDKNTEIPADKARYGMFNVLDDLSKERTRTIIDEQAKDPNSKIGAAYQSFMD